jgi:hypothetical protein
MKTIRSLLLTAVAAVLVVVLGALTAVGQSGDALLRFVHVVPGAAAVDVYVDGQLTIRALSYGGASSYVSAPSGERQITVTQSGITTPLWQQTISADPGSATTLIASSTEPLLFTAFNDDLNPLPLGRTRLTAVHALAGAPAVDVVLADGRIVIPSLAYNQPFGTFDIPVDIYDFAIVPTGGTVEDALIAPAPFALNGGTSYMLVVYGTAAAPTIMVLTQPTTPEIAGGFIRLVHGIPGAPTVDVLVDDLLLAASLSEGQATEYIAVPSGAYGVSIRASESGDELLAAALTVERDVRSTAFVVAPSGIPEVRVVVDDVSAITANASVVNVINALAEGSVAVNFSDGTTLIGAVTAGQNVLSIVQPSEMSLLIEAVVGDETVESAIEPMGGIYGGVYYSVLAAGSPPQVFVLPSVSLAQSIASAVGDETIAAAPDTSGEAVAAAPTLETPAVEATVAEAPAEPTAAQQVIIVTATPTPEAPAEPQVIVVTPTEPPPVVVAPTIAPTPGFLARVVLDPGANLQLRQYPSREAFSLGLAPANSALRILGREGEPAPLPGSTPTPTFDPANPPLTPTATPFIDPVTLLEEGEDLDPQLTWLYIVYDTPDGGTVTAWVNALYLNILNPQGRTAALRDLPTIPGNRAGVTANTSIQPPQAAQNVINVIIGNLDPGVNVHIRRVPAEQGESLALVGSSTTLELLGINEAQDWVFARYVDTSGGGVRGWISTEFLSYQLNGAPTDLDMLETRNLLTIISDEERGATFAGGIAAPVQPTANPIRDAIVAEVFLNPGANLHLRRNPNVTAESLALIPTGTQLVVSGQNETGEWLRVEFEGVNGWVSVLYVGLTRNGRTVELTDVPLIANTPTPTPQGTPEGTPASGG